MKLLLCLKCSDVRKLSRSPTPCECGASSGHYLSDGWHAEYSGPARLIGLNNHSLVDAVLKTHVDPDAGPKLDTWLFSLNGPRWTHTE